MLVDQSNKLNFAVIVRDDENYEDGISVNLDQIGT